MLSKNAKVTVENHTSSSDGRILILQVKQDEKLFYLINTYAPNVENAQIQFLRQLSSEMKKTKNHKRKQYYNRWRL